jgi:hypothetical protein
MNWPPFTPVRFLVPISVRGWAEPRAIVQPELKNPMTSLEIKPATFQLVAQCLNQLHYCESQFLKMVFKFKVWKFSLYWKQQGWRHHILATAQSTYNIVQLLKNLIITLFNHCHKLNKWECFWINVREPLHKPKCCNIVTKEMTWGMHLI